MQKDEFHPQKTKDRFLCLNMTNHDRYEQGLRTRAHKGVSIVCPRTLTTMFDPFLMARYKAQHLGEVVALMDLHVGESLGRSVWHASLSREDGISGEKA